MYNRTFMLAMITSAMLFAVYGISLLIGAPAKGFAAMSVLLTGCAIVSVVKTRLPSFISERLTIKSSSEDK